MPALTRESKSFPTLFQNLIAQMVYPPPPMFFKPPGFAILELLYSQLDGMRLQIQGPNDLAHLKSLRWITLKNVFSPKSSVQGFDSEILLFKLLRYIKKEIKLHCRATAAVLGSIKESTEFVSEYCRRVNVYIVGSLCSYDLRGRRKFQCDQRSCECAI